MIELLAPDVVVAAEHADAVGAELKDETSNGSSAMDADDPAKYSPATGSVSIYLPYD